MFVRFRLVTVLGMLLAVMAVAGVPAGPAAAGGCGTTVKAALGGPAINGVIPQGQAQADESQFLCGGNTILTVQVKNVNLPDGTVLNVILDYAPVGTITLSHHEGTLTANLGHFALSHDQIQVNNGGTTILTGWNFS